MFPHDVVSMHCYCCKILSFLILTEGLQGVKITFSNQQGPDSDLHQGHLVEAPVIHYFIVSQCTGRMDGGGSWRTCGEPPQTQGEHPHTHTQAHNLPAVRRQS